MKTLSDDAIQSAGRAILRFFDRYALSDPWGWDWRTMRIVHPEKCAFWDMLKAEWQKRHPANA